MSEMRETDTKERTEERYFRNRAILAGIVLLLAWFWISQGGADFINDSYRQFAEKVLEALFIASALAVTVDMFLKKQIAKDVFSASIGYILPAFLRDEMKAIYSNDIICVSHSLNLTLTPIENSLIQVDISIRRTIQNKGSSNRDVELNVDFDEWFSGKGHSALIEFGFRTPGAPQESVKKFKNDDLAKVPDVPKYSASLGTKLLMPEGKIEVWYSYRLFKRANDIYYLWFRYATEQPLIVVDAPGHVGWRVQFGHRLSTNVDGNKTTLPGVLLPHQYIQVRWWDKVAETEWRKA
jgi:hypothetical protein